MKWFIGLVLLVCASSPHPIMAFSARLFVGFDLGTSGARISVLEEAADQNYKEVYAKAIPWEGAYDKAESWIEAVESLLMDATQQCDPTAIASICVSGTSASCLLVDATKGTVTRAPRMYDFDITSTSEANQALEWLHSHAPPRHTARATTGSLAKLLSWHAQQPLDASQALCHQSDYISMHLMKSSSVESDWHNCLKLGFDVQNLKWPTWLTDCLTEAGISQSVLPSKVVSPGMPMGTIDLQLAERFGILPTTVLVGGTTDSNAAFFAAAGSQPPMGTAVTSLGSTLAMKQLSETYVEDADRGVYSHRFPTFSSSLSSQDDDEAWLVGGASNVGCAVLRQEGFSNDELVELSAQIDPNQDSDLSYYPLTKTGERFPVADSTKEPILEPVPKERRDYLHGILQGISDVERDGFQVLGELGAKPNRPNLVWTCGGGSRNDMWSAMRQRRLRHAFGEESSVVVQRAENTEASYGAALLAAASFV